METGKQILMMLKNVANNEPLLDDIYSIGTISNILQLLKLPDGTIKVLVEGIKGRRSKNFRLAQSFYLSEISYLKNDPLPESENQSLSRTLMSQFDRYVRLNKKVPPEIVASLAGIDDVSRLIDTIAAHIAIKLDQKQKILETVDTHDRLQLLISMMDGEIELLEVEKSLRNRVKTQMEKSQESTI